MPNQPPLNPDAVAPGKCYGCDNPKSTNAQLETVKGSIGLCNRHWNFWIAHFIGTGYAPCAAHLIKESGNE